MYELRIQTNMLNGYALGSRPRSFKRAMQLCKYLRRRNRAMRFAYVCKIAPFPTWR